MLNAVLVGIVTYNPDIDRLKENIDAVKKQTNHILIVDNGSNNYNIFVKSFSGDIQFIRNDKNEGIAMALSQIMEYSRENEYSWVLTLDQDSIIEPGLANEYIKYASNEAYTNVGMFTCLIKDRNFSDEKYEKQNRSIIEVPYCITSAAFTNVDKYFDTDGYDERFFIDAVDFDICYSLRERGYKIARINFTGLYHEVGHGENKRFLWKKIVIYHQKPFRIYYLARNIIWMHKKHNTYGFMRMIKKEIVFCLRIILYEDCRKEKWNAFKKGIKDARYY